MSIENRKLSSLEALRGCAALYVFIHHAHLLPNQGFGRLLYFGQEAVITFFILSGFVICYSTSRRQMGFREYLVHRVKRIYPIFLVALGLAYLSRSFVEGHWLGGEWVALVGNLFMLQDVAALKRGVWVDTYYGNSPLWSLSYEWWFYIFFIPLGLNGRFAGGKSLVFALIVSVFGFLGYQYAPNQLCLFLGYLFIWWAGVELAKEYSVTGRATFFGQRGLLLGLAFMTFLWGIPVLVQWWRHIELQLGVDPVLQFRHYLAAFLFVVMGIFMSRGGGEFPLGLCSLLFCWLPYPMLCI